MAEPWSRRLCPWLAGAFDRLDRARAQGQLGHAWLLTGPRGVGKANLAWALADRVVRPARDRPGPLDAAAAAEAMRARPEDSDRHPDLHWLAPAIDKRSITVDQVRETIAALELTSHAGGGKALAVLPAEALTLAGANALLKTLEEPTTDTYFFLVSHQPGFLPATVRSRCQVLAVPTPPADSALAWLGGGARPSDAGELKALLSFAGGAPLRALALQEDDFLSINSRLEDEFQGIYDKRLDPQDVAEAWLKSDPALFLDWLAVRLEWAIKGRLAPDAWTPVTDLGGDRLHNYWRGLTLKTLFDRLQNTKGLLNQLGSGVNLDLALRVLMLGLEPGSSES